MMLGFLLLLGWAHQTAAQCAGSPAAAAGYTLAFSPAQINGVSADTDTATTSAGDPCLNGYWGSAGTTTATIEWSCTTDSWVQGSGALAGCTAWTTCVAGEYVTAGTATADRSCPACEAGFFSTTNDAAACSAWTTCVAGQYVMAGSATADRSCPACAAGFFSTTNNAAACSAWDTTTCLAGEYVMAGTATVDHSCPACAAGFFSTTNDAAACSAWDTTTCVAGQYVMAGTATVDRSCPACASGTFTAAADQTSCATWSVCPFGERILAAGTSTSEQTCTAIMCGTADVRNQTRVRGADGNADANGNFMTETVLSTNCLCGANQYGTLQAVDSVALPGVVDTCMDVEAGADEHSITATIKYDETASEYETLNANDALDLQARNVLGLTSGLEWMHIKAEGFTANTTAVTVDAMVKMVFPSSEAASAALAVFSVGIIQIQAALLPATSITFGPSMEVVLDAASRVGSSMLGLLVLLVAAVLLA